MEFWTPGSEEQRRWAWREAPQVHSRSAMQTTCKSARVSRSRRSESDPQRRALAAGTHARSLRAVPLALSPAALPYPILPARTRLAGSPRRRVCSPWRSELGARSARLRQGRPRRARCLGYPAAFAARVSEPAPRFCPGAAPGSHSPRVGVEGRDPGSEACPRLPVGGGLLRAQGGFLFAGGRGEGLWSVRERP